METAMLTADFLSTLQTRYNLGSITRIRPLTGGEWKQIYRLDTPERALVLSISHPTAAVAGVQYEHDLLRYLNPHLPQIPAPLVAHDGSTWFVEAGRIVTLFPLMPGQVVDRDQARLPAARFLARYHQVALAYPDHRPRPDIPAWHAVDWEQVWDWPGIEALLHTLPTDKHETAQRFWRDGGEWVAEIVARREQIAHERRAIRQWLHQQAHADHPLLVAPIHDDYHRKNLLLTGNTVSALIDWDGCHPDWLLLDLSVATWEFCLDKGRHTLKLGLAHSFVDAYAKTGGPITPADYALILPLICCRRLIEILSDLQKAVTGDGWNADAAEYTVHNLRSLDNLRQSAT